ncbi:hypothetical protein SMICM304S_06748 [Streptomyces microflavus]
MRGPGAPALGAAAAEQQIALTVRDPPDEPGQHAAASSEPSQSQKQTNSASAASSPAWQAAPNPRRSSVTTLAPRERAISADPSVEPLSTTIARQPSGIRSSTQGRAPASSRQGRTTSAFGMADCGGTASG